MERPFWFLKPRQLALWAVLAGAVIPRPCADSLWQPENTVSMFADRKARRVGDLITIIVQENNVSTKEKSTKTNRKSSVDTSLSSIFFSPSASGLLTKKGQLPALKYSSSSDFDGGGEIRNSERITARIPVRVIDVLPNGQMIVEGRRNTYVSGEQQEAILRGIVRPDDVKPDNTVLSFNVADASIHFVTKGVITDSEKKGWFTKFWAKVNPF